MVLLLTCGDLIAVHILRKVWYNEADAASEVSWSIIVASGDEGLHSMQITSDYIVGLVDGEGSFTVYVRNPKHSSERVRRVRAEPKFYVKLVEKDKKILYALQAFFDCGQVYFQKDTRANHQNCYRYEVGNRKDLERVIIPFFKTHPLRFPSRAQDFKIFCQLMGMVERSEHLTQSGLAAMYRLKQKMH